MSNVRTEKLIIVSQRYQAAVISMHKLLKMSNKAILDLSYTDLSEVQIYIINTVVVNNYEINVNLEYLRELK